MNTTETPPEDGEPETPAEGEPAEPTDEGEVIAPPPEEPPAEPESPEDDESIDAEAEEEPPAEGPVLLNFEALHHEANRRKERAIERERGETFVAAMLSSRVLDLLDGADLALSNAVREMADAAYTRYEERGVGEIAKRHSLAGQIRAGRFDT